MIITNEEAQPSVPERFVEQCKEKLHFLPFYFGKDNYTQVGPFYNEDMLRAEFDLEKWKKKTQQEVTKRRNMRRADFDWEEWKKKTQQEWTNRRDMRRAEFAQEKEKPEFAESPPIKKLKGEQESTLFELLELLESEP